MLRTAFTELVGCQMPIQQAAMGAVAAAQALTDQVVATRATRSGSEPRRDLGRTHTHHRR